jgi:drug/metabolite transporter (DMT)-like permease
VTPRKTGEDTARRVAAHSSSLRFGATDLLMFLMTSVWGANFIAIKYSLKPGEGFLPLSFNGLRFTIASIVMLIVAAATVENLKVLRRDFWKLLFFGFLANTLYQSLFILGMNRTRAGNAALIVSTTPLFTAVIGRIRRQEFFTARAAAGLVMAFAGMAMIIASGPSEVSWGETIGGDLMLVGATVCWSFYTVGAKPLIHAYGPTKATAIMILCGTPLLLVVCASSLAKQNWSDVRLVAWAGLFYSALFAIALAYVIWNYAVRKIGSTRTAIYSNFTPVVAMLMAWPALGEIPTAGQAAGAAIILAGIYFVRSGMIAAAPERETEESSLAPGRN